MQILIDISEESYETIIEEGEVCRAGIEKLIEAIQDGKIIPKHGRLIDADALADKLQEVSVLQRYEDVKIDHRCTVADVLTSLTYDLKGTALLGYELCPTIIEADKEDRNDH